MTAASPRGGFLVVAAGEPGGVVRMVLEMLFVVQIFRSVLSFVFEQDEGVYPSCSRGDGRGTRDGHSLVRIDRRFDVVCYFSGNCSIMVLVLRIGT